MQDGKSELGDRIAEALSVIGVTDERITAWLGKPCGCKERQEKLNQLHRWSIRVLRGRITKAKEYLATMLSEED